MHQLFRDATNVDASATQAPGGAYWSRHHKVAHGYFGAQSGSFFGSGQTSRTTTNDDQIIVVLLFRFCVRDGIGFGEQELQGAVLVAFDRFVASTHMGSVYKHIGNSLLASFLQKSVLNIRAVLWNEKEELLHNISLN